MQFIATEVLLIIELIIAFWIAISVGANDATMASVVGSKFLGLTSAVIIGAIMDFLGATVLGYRVEETISRGLMNCKVTEFDALIAIVSVAVWLFVASCLGWPTSITNAVVGACIGLGLIKAGVQGVKWHTLSIIGIAWLLAPLFGMLISVIFLKVILFIVYRTTKGLRDRVGAYYLVSFLLLFWSCIAAFSKGANDIANATALLTLVYGNSLLLRTLCGIGMSIGLITIGRKVLRTVGLKLSALDPPSSLSVQLGVALTMLLGTLLKIPLSATQIMVTSIIGVSRVRGTWISMPNLKKVVLIWALTFPITCALTMFLYYLVHLLLY